VARILDRAQEIENARSTEPSDGIEPTALIEAATEVGIDPNAVRDSLAIERFSVERSAPARLDRLAGPNRVVVEREVPLSATEVMDGLEAWLSSVHRLTCDRRTPGMLIARRRSDSSAQIGRAAAGVRGEGRLGVVSDLVAEAVGQTVGSSPTRPRTIVRISADRSTPRAARLVGGGAVGSVGVGGGAAVGLVAGAPWLLLAVPFALGGYAVARSGRAHADRLDLELERLLSAVERGRRPTGLLDRVAQRAKDAVTRRLE